MQFKSPIECSEQNSLSLGIGTSPNFPRTLYPSHMPTFQVCQECLVPKKEAFHILIVRTLLWRSNMPVGMHYYEYPSSPGFQGPLQNTHHLHCDSKHHLVNCLEDLVLDH